MGMSVLPAVYCVYAVPKEASRGQWDPGIGVLDGCKMLGTEPRYSVRTPGILNSYPAP